MAGAAEPDEVVGLVAAALAPLDDVMHVERAESPADGAAMALAHEDRRAGRAPGLTIACHAGSARAGPARDPRPALAPRRPAPPSPIASG